MKIENVALESNIERPSVYHYDCYRKFISDFEVYLQYEKSLSLSKICQMVGFKHRGYLKWVIEGNRNLNFKWAEKLAAAFEMSQQETYFLRLLILEKEVSTKEELQEILVEKQSAREFNLTKQINQDLSDLYSKWYINATLVAVGLNPKITADDLSHKFGIEANSALDALACLERLGLIQRDALGNWKKTARQVETPQSIGDLVRQYHTSNLKLAEQAIQKCDPSKRELYGLTIGLTKDQFQVLKRQIWKFLQRLNSGESTDQQSEKILYQVSTQLFPLDHEYWKKS